MSAVRHEMHEFSKTRQDADSPEGNLSTGLRVLWSALIAFTVFTLYPCFAADTIRVPTKKKGAGALFRIRRGDKWGYMSRNGDTVIPAQFEEAGDFFGGLARVETNGKWGYVDQTGRPVIRYRFENVGDFSERLAPAQVERKWGFIDPNGNFVIWPRFQGVSGFSGGLAQIDVWDTIQCGRDSYTKENAPLYAFTLLDTLPMMTPACFSEDARYGYIDSRGNAIIPPSFVLAGNFSEGLSPVRGERSSKYGYIDKTGKMVIQPRFDQAFSFSEGLAAVEVGFEAEDGKKTGGKWGFIDQRGSFVVQPTFELVRAYSEGVAEVSVDSISWGYIDKRGVFVIPPRYSQTSCFSEGMALVWSDEEDNGYYIDKVGKRALTLRLRTQWPFVGGLTIAGDQGELKYVDRTGRIVAPFESHTQRR
jgi:hypothetical protein